MTRRCYLRRPQAPLPWPCRRKRMATINYLLAAPDTNPLEDKVRTRWAMAAKCRR